MLSKGIRVDSKTIEVVWRAWYGDETCQLSFPPDWQVIKADMVDAPELSAESVKSALQKPIASPSLRELAEGRKDVVIVVDDLGRPTPAHRLLPAILEELGAVGLDDSRICILVAVGAHRPAIWPDMAKKLGQRVVKSLHVDTHHPYENLQYLGQTTRGTPIYVSRFFTEADLKIGIGCITPLKFAGFGGGGGIVMPGVCGIETIAATHRQAREMAPNNTGCIDDNEFRAEVDEIASVAGLDMVVNAVVNSRREIAGLFAGRHVSAHREAISLACRTYATKLPDQLDAIVLNAYPKDIDMQQAGMALNFLAVAGFDVLKPDGIIVLMSANPEGVGFHHLYGPGMQDFRPYQKGDLGGRRLFIFSPGLSSADVETLFPSDTILFREWSNVVMTLARLKKGPLRVAVVPCASMQLVASSHGTSPGACG